MAEEKKARGRPKHVKVTCVAANVWTSKGKLLRGDSETVPPEEAKALKETGMVK
ncbi:MAG: hypothetical protein ACPGSI_17430 [Pikeienuella sp.]